MKRSTCITTAALGAILVASTAAIAQGPGRQGRQGQQRGQGAGCCVLGPGGGLNQADIGPLSPAAVAELETMRQEEKLARDVYKALYKKWQVRAFDNISRAEQRHMDALKMIFDSAGLVDPIADDTPGVFASEKFQGLYLKLTEQGSRSLLDAYTVGALIEELDIADLKKAILSTDDPVLLRVYDNLMRGSRNHLRAYDGLIVAAGGDYDAKHLPQKEYDAIAASPHERGNAGNRGDRGNRGNRGVRGQQGQRGNRADRPRGTGSRFGG